MSASMRGPGDPTAADVAGSGVIDAFMAIGLVGAESVSASAAVRRTR